MKKVLFLASFLSALCVNDVQAFSLQTITSWWQPQLSAANLSVIRSFSEPTAEQLLLLQRTGKYKKVFAGIDNAIATCETSTAKVSQDQKELTEVERKQQQFLTDLARTKQEFDAAAKKLAEHKVVLEDYKRLISSIIFTLNERTVAYEQAFKNVALLQNCIRKATQDQKQGLLEQEEKAKHEQQTIGKELAKSVELATKVLATYNPQKIESSVPSESAAS